MNLLKIKNTFNFDFLVCSNNFEQFFRKTNLNDYLVIKKNFFTILIKKSFSLKKNQVIISQENLRKTLSFIKIKIDKQNLDFETDRGSRLDIYYFQEKNNFIICSDLQFFSFIGFNTIDNFSLSHSLCVYGARPPKKHTIFKKVKRVGFNQKLSLMGNRLKIKNYNLKINNIDQKVNLNSYKKYFIKAIKQYTNSKDKKIILLSSGWDSTAILANLKLCFPKSQIIGVIGRMKYSSKRIANDTEIKKAKKFAKKYKIKLDIFDYNYSKKISFWDYELKTFLKNNQFSSIVAINRWNIIKYIKSRYGNNITIYNGEMSDGAHNFGFSQYVSLFHNNSQSLREYGDKLNTYLFGPTFLKYIYSSGEPKNDLAWKIISGNFKSGKSIKLNNKYKINFNFFLSLLIYKKRIPLLQNQNLPFLKKLSKQKYFKELLKEYFEEYAKLMTEKNCYSCYLNLYNSFHWQGSTVNCIDKICQYHQIKYNLPFYEKNIIKFLEQMPEKYGRGLNFTNTKYPLKQILKDKNLNYPFEYQEGDHSYIYDRDPNFNHNYELLYNSGFKKLFIQSLKSKKFLNKLNRDHYNIVYINDITKKYIKGYKIDIRDVDNLFSICMHTLIYS